MAGRGPSSPEACGDSLQNATPWGPLTLLLLPLLRVLPGVGALSNPAVRYPLLYIPLLEGPGLGLLWRLAGLTDRPAGSSPMGPATVALLGVPAVLPLLLVQEAAAAAAGDSPSGGLPVLLLAAAAGDAGRTAGEGLGRRAADAAAERLGLEVETVPDAWVPDTMGEASAPYWTAAEGLLLPGEAASAVEALAWAPGEPEVTRGAAEGDALLPIAAATALRMPLGPSDCAAAA